MATSRIDRVMSAVVTVAAIVMAAAVVRGELMPKRATATVGQGMRPPDYLVTWSMLLPKTRLIGDSLAPVRIIEFGDLECPACKRFHQGTLARLQKEFGSKVAVNFVHLPLSIHRFAPSAAQAAECSAVENKFGSFVSSVYALQDSIGLRPWRLYARDAGIENLDAFEKCAQRPPHAALIDSGIALASRMDVSATPTVIVNGWRFYLPPTYDELSRVIQATLERRNPFPQSAAAEPRKTS